MARWNRFVGGLRAWFRRRKNDEQLTDELQAYLDQVQQRKIQQGLNPYEARRAAQLEIGSLGSVLDATRRVGWESSADACVQDLRRAIRRVRLSPGYATIIVGAMSLSIGATLVVFTIVNAVWIRPRPVTDPDRVVLVIPEMISRPESNTGSGDTASWAPGGLRLLGTSPGFAGVAGQVQNSAMQGAFAPRLRLDAVSRPVETLGVTWQYFSMLGVAIRGVDFGPDDDRPGAAPVAIISDRLWRGAFGSRADIIGTTVPAVPVALRVVGVAAPGFEGAMLGERTDVWVPASLVPRLAAAPISQCCPLSVLARMAPGVTVEAAQQFIVGVLPGPRTGRQTQRRVIPLPRLFGAPNHRTITIDESAMLKIVALTAALVFLGGCMTLAALVLVHYERRRHELGIRLALGASRQRLAAQVGCELGVLALAGCVAAVLVARWSLDALPAFSLPGGLDLARVDLSLDWRVLGVAVVASIVALAAAATLPIARFVRAGAATSLAGTAGATTASSHRVRRVMLGVHVAATIVVLVSAALFVRTILFGLTQGAGFDVDHTAFLDLRTRSTFDESDLQPSSASDKRTADVRRLVDGLRGMPGVETVALGAGPVGPDQAWYVQSSVVDVDVDGDPRRLQIANVNVGPEYLDALGVSIIAGRGLDESDATLDDDGPTVITASLAGMLWPDQSPIGHHLTSPGHPVRTQTVVGVVDLAYGSVLVPANVTFNVRRIEAMAAIGRFGVVVRTRDPMGTVEPIHRLIDRVFPNAIRADVATGRELIERDLGRQRLGAWFFSGFGLIALLLGVWGVFGLVAYLADSRRREFGIRLALGATNGRLIQGALVAGLEPVLVGTACGLIAATLLARTTESLLLGVTGLDALAYASAGTLMVVVASVAALAAALRLRRLSPLDLLRAN